MSNLGRMRLFMCISIISIDCVTAKCAKELSLDISDGEQVEPGFIRNNGILYDKNNYFESDGKIYGCICNLKKCIRKCCPIGQEISNKICQSSNRTFFDLIQQNTLKTFDEDVYFPISSFLNCTTKERRKAQDNVKLTITQDGHLFYTGILDQLNYCLDYFAGSSDFSALYCWPEGMYSQLHTLGMIISMPFLLATFLVYALLPDRNLPAKALMCYVLSLLFAYILLVTIQLNNLLDSASCKTLAFFCYFFFMASFFWMNASCLDIFFTFSGIRGLLGEKKKENRRFMYYSAYAWGVPVLMVGFAAIFTFEKTDNLTWATGIGEGQCWFRNGWPTGIYFYFPIATLLIVNIVLFSITTYKIKRVQRDTKMLKNVDSRKNRKYDNNDKQRFNLYVKLLFAMGINWSMEVISWAIMWRWSNVPEYVWVLTDFCNAVYGVFIFFIFVFKRNIWMMLKKRYLQFTGRPQQAHTLTSVNRTTITTSLQSLSKSLERKITPTCLSYDESDK